MFLVLYYLLFMSELDLSTFMMNNFFKFQSTFIFFMIRVISSNLYLFGLWCYYMPNRILTFSPLFALSYNLMSNFSYIRLLLMLLSLFMKLGVFPFFIWLPSVYEGISMKMLMMFTIISKLGMLWLMMTFGSEYILFLMFRMMSIIIRLMGGITTNKMKKFMAYSSMSAMGYMFMMMYSMKEYTQLIPMYIWLVMYFMNNWMMLFSLNYLSMNKGFMMSLKDLYMINPSWYPLLFFFFSFLLFY